ncbi:hypothetical protein GEMRC1_012153 [Eukaryota sp. GEM-RC1]
MNLETFRFSRILATVGPSSFDKIKVLLDKGVNAFRLNFSHGSHEDHERAYNLIRSLSTDDYLSTAIVADLQGPKIRIGTFENGPVTTPVLDSPHPEIFEAFLTHSKVNHYVLIDDGKVKLDVVSVSDTEIVCVSKLGGALSDRKGVNLPTVQLGVSAMTEKDRRDLKCALQLGVDYVCLSFVQHAEDVREARAFIEDWRSVNNSEHDAPHIISKIEKPQALDNIDEIIGLSDAIMVARGDLGVEVPAASVPVIQKRLIGLCREAGKPIIIATHCLEKCRFQPPSYPG